MFFILLLTWIIFNGQITMEIVFFGIVLSALLTWFMIKFMDYKLRYDLIFIKKTKDLLILIAVIAIEIAKANEQVFYWIVSNKYRMEPAIVVFKVDLKKEWARVLLANCITLTPGTITASVEDNELTVHCLDKELGKGLSECAFVKVLRRLENFND